MDYPQGQSAAPSSGPDVPFGASAAALEPVAGQADMIRQDAVLGDLVLDPAAAGALIETIGRLRDNAAQLASGSGELDQPLRFGANWVAEFMAHRLRGAAIGGDHAVTPMLSEFARALSTLENAVKVAADRYVIADQQSTQDMERATEVLNRRAQP
jgi:X-X-X-Leu-X-X-Gly heptad repeat protein